MTIVNAIAFFYRFAKLRCTQRILAYNKVQMLYLFQSKQVETVREVSAVLGKSEATIHRWLFQYKEGGLENLKFGVHLTFANTSSGKVTIEISPAQRKELGNTLDIPLRSR